LCSEVDVFQASKQNGSKFCPSRKERYTIYGYDLQGNLTSVTDAANNLTTITYDLLGRKQTMIDPDMGSWSFSKC
jgi:YD repeat-containing protein